MIKINALDKHFGGLHVTRNVTFNLYEGELCALIGPNGAGKTTLVNLISGTLVPSKGEISLNGIDITHKTQMQRVKLGITRTFQITTLAPHFTPLEQVMAALFEREGIKSLWRNRASYKNLTLEAYDLLSRFSLEETANDKTENLAYGDKRLLSLTLALALRPKVLLLDEPMAGVAKAETPRLFEALEKLPADIALLMIEHDMDLVFRFAKRIIVLTEGEILADGTPEEIRKNPDVRRAYLGDAL